VASVCKKCKDTLANTIDNDEPLIEKSKSMELDINNIQKQRYVKMLLTPKNVKKKKIYNAELSDAKKENKSNSHTSHYKKIDEQVAPIESPILNEEKESLPNNNSNRESSIEESDEQSTSIENNEEVDLMESKEENSPSLSDLNDTFIVTSNLEHEVTNKDCLNACNIIKVHRMLAEPECSITMEGKINLIEEATEITSVTNEVSLDNCELVPTSFIPNSYKVNIGKLFVQCNLHKTIEYTTSHITEEDSCTFTKRQKKFDIPFSFCTTVTFPENRHPLFALMDQQSFKFLNDEKYQNESNRKIVRNKIDYNEPIQFELISAKFNEVDNFLNPVEDRKIRTFRSFHSSLSVDVRIGILQMQKVKLDKNFENN
jgi:hypothetical protein